MVFSTGVKYTTSCVNAAFRSINHTDTLTASRALPHLESLALLRRSEQRRGPGVYYTLCVEHPQTARELAQRLHRNAKYLRDAYLSPLVREGRLQLTGLAQRP